ncbi:hypothetical protein PROSTU_01048 [Providencia stuartii ATCC 25827]|uniref:Uncharacterized protein n=1 Tax=Providencia stuartii ATCC 25827 TaxID=471874 RepID=A0AA87CSP0_PROST|nr:hypothetical protein PROSTU_01048 [Providencia stuartii ATCC 25827]
MDTYLPVMTNALVEATTILAASSLNSAEYCLTMCSPVMLLRQEYHL